MQSAAARNSSWTADKSGESRDLSPRSARQFNSDDHHHNYHHSKVHATLIQKHRVQLYNQNRADLERSSIAHTWAHVFLFSDSLGEAKAMMGGYYINVALIATLLSGVSIAMLLETDTSGAEVWQRATLGGSGILAFGVFLATTVDCVLIDNSTRKLRSYQHCFIYLAHSRQLLSNTMIFFCCAFVCITVQMCSMANILFPEITWPVIGAAIVE